MILARTKRKTGNSCSDNLNSLLVSSKNISSTSSCILTSFFASSNIDSLEDSREKCARFFLNELGLLTIGSSFFSSSSTRDVGPKESVSRSRCWRSNFLRVELPNSSLINEGRFSRLTEDSSVWEIFKSDSSCAVLRSNSPEFIIDLCFVKYSVTLAMHSLSLLFLRLLRSRFRKWSLAMVRSSSSLSSSSLVVPEPNLSTQ